MPLTIPEFVARWQRASQSLSERSAAQSHFIDLCDMLGQDRPAAVDATGETFTFEKGVTRTGGGHGFADVWYRNHFGWEYKRNHRNLEEAYRQLLQYREDLENPPLLVVCDLNRFEVHTNFTGTAKQVYAFDLADLLRGQPTETCALPPLEVLRALFENPNRLKPTTTTAAVTEQAAGDFAALASLLQRYGYEPEPVAHFLMRLLFCLFAEDVGLLPNKLFERLVEATQTRPTVFTERLRQLFAAMATGGWYGPEEIRHFNGGLFTDDSVLELSSDSLEVLLRVAKLDWANIEPAIFGTLFERSLDPAKRSQLGAHYTSAADILLVVEPVLMAPLRRRWEVVRAKADDLVAKRDGATSRQARTTQQSALQRLLMDFAGEIASVRVLDPACGSGNFLYLSLKRLLDLEKDVISYAAKNGLTAFFPRVEPSQLHGIEKDPYAHELAQIVVWIGYIQWLHDNGFGIPDHPILKPLNTVEERDAVLAFDDVGRPYEPDWPEADVIIGNPPFLGSKLLRANLGDAYVDALFAVHDGMVPREADLVCYWYEKARQLIAAGQARRAGLLATNSIRGGANQRVLSRIKETGDIFFAWADRPWVLDGAAVRVSMVGFDEGRENDKMLDGQPVAEINPDLTSALNLTNARPLAENAGLAFMGGTKGGPFDLDSGTAARMLSLPVNINGRPNSDVIRPWVTGVDLTRRIRGMSIIDFGVSMSESDASLYEAPFEYVRKLVLPARSKSRTTRDEWWIHERPRPAMRQALAPLSRFIGTSMVAKYRNFVWLHHPTLPENLVIVIARDDDYFFGVLHSRPHELWSLRLGTSLEDRPRYTPTTTFETFPFPWPPGSEPVNDPLVTAIADAARDLAAKRDAWLNPPGASEADLKKRTLTNLYNQRPAWLANAHAALDRAVFDAYGWPHDLSDEAILERLLALNLSRAAATADAQ